MLKIDTNRREKLYAVVGGKWRNVVIARRGDKSLFRNHTISGDLVDYFFTALVSAQYVTKYTRKRKITWEFDSCAVIADDCTSRVGKNLSRNVSIYFFQFCGNKSSDNARPPGVVKYNAHAYISNDSLCIYTRIYVLCLLGQILLFFVGSSNSVLLEHTESSIYYSQVSLNVNECVSWCLKKFYRAKSYTYIFYCIN